MVNGVSHRSRLLAKKNAFPTLVGDRRTDKRKWWTKGRAEGASEGCSMALINLLKILVKYRLMVMHRKDWLPKDCN